MAANALEIARSGMPKSPLYLAGNVGGTPVVLHGEGDRVILSKDGQHAEVDFEPRSVTPMPTPAAAAAAPAAAAAAAAAAPGTPIISASAGVPLPVAPAGVVDSSWTGAEEQTAPGASAIDALIPHQRGTGDEP